MLWSFVYLVVRTLFALVWLLARPRRSKEFEILLLRHELAVLRRQAGRARLIRADRALFAALSRLVPRTAWANLAVKPDTLLRWHRQLVARRWTYTHRKAGRPPLERSVRELIVRLASENPHWGYKRIVGELKGLGVRVSATSVRKVLLGSGLQPAPERRDPGAPGRDCGHAARDQGGFQKPPSLGAATDRGKRVGDGADERFRLVLGEKTSYDLVRGAHSGKRVGHRFEQHLGFAFRARGPHARALCLTRRRAAFVMASTSSSFVMSVLLSIPMLAASSTNSGFL